MDHEDEPELDEAIQASRYSSLYGYFDSDDDEKQRNYYVRVEAWLTELKKLREENKRLESLKEGREHRLFDAPPEGFHQRRKAYPGSEQVYAEQWEKRNRRVSGINHGFTYLEWLLCPEMQEYPEEVSIRDVRVAAAVIQWLGTNCGGAFVHECERIITKGSARRQCYERDIHNRDNVAKKLMEE